MLNNCMARKRCVDLFRKPAYHPSRVPHRARSLSFHSEPASEDHDEGEQPRMYMQRDRSNRPIRNRIVKQLGFTRRPFDDPLTPGLRRTPLANPIGFLTDAYAEPKPDIFDLINEGLTSTEIVERMGLTSSSRTPK